MKQGTETPTVEQGVAGWTWDVVGPLTILALVWALLHSCMPPSAPAMQILDAMDHAELEAEISDRAVSRITLAGDRIARVIRGPDGFVVEHDAARGDVYLRPGDVSSVVLGGGS